VQDGRGVLLVVLTRLGVSRVLAGSSRRSVARCWWDPTRPVLVKPDVPALAAGVLGCPGVREGVGRVEPGPAVSAGGCPAAWVRPGASCCMEGAEGGWRSE
ncbi:MAG: hypothetical protein ACOY3F_03490, partial [Bacillota bacterium]